MGSHGENPTILMSLTHALAVILAVVCGGLITRVPQQSKRLTIAVVCLLASPLPLIIGLLPLAVDLSIVYFVVLIVEMVTVGVVTFVARREKNKS